MKSKNQYTFINYYPESAEERDNFTDELEKKGYKCIVDYDEADLIIKTYPHFKEYAVYSKE